MAWWAPYWFHLPRTLRTWGEFFRWRALARVSAVSLVVGAAIVICLKVALPAIQLPPPWRMLLALPAFYSYLLVSLAVHLLIPSQIEVRKNRIHVMTGQAHWVVKSDAITRTRIVVFALDRIRLRVFYRYKDKRRSRSVGIGPKVNLATLCEVLPVQPEVWDAQHRYRELHPAAREQVA